MKKLQSLIALIAITAPIHAYASEITSGEHSNFTRIFISEVDSEKYSVSSNGSTITIETGVDTTASTSRFWDKINNEKIQEISSSNGKIELNLGCECKAYYSRYENGIFLDIYKSNDTVQESTYQNSVNISEEIIEKEPQKETKSIDLGLFTIPHDQNFSESYIFAFHEHEHKSHLKLEVSGILPRNSSCPSDAFLDIFTRREDTATEAHHEWLNSRDFMNEYHIKSAESYILNGMATEALTHLRSIPDKNEWSNNLLLIAHTVSEAKEIDLSYWRDCAPGAQLWHALSAHEIGKMSTAEMNQILSYYYSMPITLRSTLNERWIDILSHSENQVDLGAFEANQENLKMEEIYRLDSSQIVDAMSRTDIEADKAEDISIISEKFLYFSENSETLSQIVKARIDMHIQNENFEHAYDDIIKYGDQIENDIKSRIEKIINGAIESKNDDLLMRIYYEIDLPELSRQTDEKINEILDQYGMLAQTHHTRSDLESPFQPEATTNDREVIANVSSAMRAIQEANDVEMKIQNEIFTNSSL